MATISQIQWKRYIARLRRINDTAAEEFKKFIIDKGGYGNIERQKLIDYAYGISTKYGEASAALSAQMYDAIAELSEAVVPAAVPAETATYQEVAKTVNGILKKSSNENMLADGIGRLVKMAGTDTMLSNAYRDRPKGKGSKRRHSGAQVAWIPSGDTCAFCIMLASKGWVNQTEWAANSHSEHIHANCDCTYAVRFNDNLTFDGYDPDEYKEIYENAEGSTRNEKFNSMRREYREENKDKINAQKRANYARKKEAEKESLNPIDKLKATLNEAYETHRVRNNLISTPIDELGDRSPIKVSFNNISEKTQEVFERTITTLAKEYDSTLQEVRSMSAEEAMFQFKKSFAAVSHNYSVDSSSLLINPTKCKNYDKMVDRIRQLSDQNYCVKMPYERANEYVATHEFAHTLLSMVDDLDDRSNWLQADYDTIRTARKEIESLYTDYLKTLKELEEKANDFELKSINALTDGKLDEAQKLGEEAEKFKKAFEAEKISEYSMANSDEFLAESFANEKIGIESKPYAKQAFEILNKYFRR